MHLTAEGEAAWRSPWGPCDPVSVPHTRVGDQGGRSCPGLRAGPWVLLWQVWRELPRRKAPSYAHRAPPSPLPPPGEKGCSPSAQASPYLIPRPRGQKCPGESQGAL